MKEIYQQFLLDDFDEHAAKEEIEKQKENRKNMGEVNLTAIQEYEALKERHNFILGQRQDLLEFHRVSQGRHKKNQQDLPGKIQQNPGGSGSET